MVTLTLATAATKRVELGTSVLVAGLHQPFQKARALATLDSASGGRVVGAWAPSEVGPKPTRPIPVLLAGATLASFRRIADHADGWIPVATDPAHLAGQWKQLQALAAGRDRRRPIRLSIATTVTITPGRGDEQDRPPFAGSLEQVTSDAIRFTQAVPATDLFMSLSGSLTSGQLTDTAGTLYAALRAAGV